jgi:hypothetical protein
MKCARPDDSQFDLFVACLSDVPLRDQRNTRERLAKSEHGYEDG